MIIGLTLWVTLVRLGFGPLAIILALWVVSMMLNAFFYMRRAFYNG